MPEIMAYGCSSAAGSGVGAFWESLARGDDLSKPEAGKHWRLPPSFELRTFPFPVRKAGVVLSARELLVSRLVDSWSEALDSLPNNTREALRSTQGRNLGVIFASTKGCIEDFIWEGNADLSRDSLAPVLEDFVARVGLSPRRMTCVSNACASSLCALAMACQWIRRGQVEQVLLLAAEQVGPFIAHGFQTLRALSPDRVRPFAADRTGLQLGEAAAAILIGSDGADPRGETRVHVQSVGIDIEGYAVTRPSDTGDSLRRACERALGVGNGASVNPDFIVAHGTATEINDLTEDRVISGLFGDRVPLTATKWCIGHTLGASGAMDLIAASEVIRRKSIFRIASTSATPTMKARYLHAGTAADLSEKGAFWARKAMILSLGFGGTHASAILAAGAGGNAR